MRDFPHVWFVASLACAALLACAAAAPAAEKEEGFTSLFDGKTLDGWDGNPKFWSVEDGAITGQTTKENPTRGNTFLIYRKGEPADFELRFMFRMFGGNSGVQFRSVEVDKWVISGYQGDFDASGGYTGILYEERGRGILARRGFVTVVGEDGKKTIQGKTTPEQTILDSYKKEDWNEFIVVARGNEIVEKLNGNVTVKVIDHQKDKRRMKGLIALQLHAGPPMKVQFKQIRIKDLSNAPKATTAPVSGKKRVTFIAGRRSHGYGSHSHNAGCLLLARLLQENVPGVETVVYQNGWPKDSNALEGADAIVMFCDGGGGHMVNPHLEQVDQLAKKGVGIACLHYGVEVPKGKPGDCLLDWIGGYFETHWSVNPHWKARFEEFPDHPVANGLTAFEIEDEWYFHMRFREGMKGVTPILSAVAPESTMRRGDGAHSGNPQVRKAVAAGKPQHLAWVAERPGGGRGFGFTGGHWHWNWASDNFRKTVLNGIVWVAGLDVPEGGVPSKTPTVARLQENLDYPTPNNFDTARIEQMIEQWNGQ